MLIVAELWLGSRFRKPAAKFALQLFEVDVVFDPE